MDYPYFTAADPALVRGGEGRDPIGLQPVWSAFGRGLVPNLASPVTQVNGIKSVLLIHWLSEEPLESFLGGGGRSFREYFRLMEGLLEYHLWSTSESRDAHCYGSRALGADATGFNVTAHDGRTAVNGLYQYYRGTCRRADLLDQDWNVQGLVSKALAAAWDDSATPELVRALTDPLDVRAFPLTPAKVFAAAGQLKRSLEKVFASTSLHAVLQAQLLGPPPHVAFAKQCSELFLNYPESDGPEPELGKTKWCADQLLAWLGDDTCPARPLLVAMERVQQCEPFLIAVQDGFDIVRASPAATVSELASELTEIFPAVEKKANIFLGLEGAGHATRMGQLLEVAQAALSGPRDFLYAVIEYHGQCMKDRGRAPLVIAEADTVVVMAAADRTKESAKARLQRGYPWDNSYYLWTAGTVYRQLFGATHG